jgi:RHS repeat-associated protein
MLQTSNNVNCLYMYDITGNPIVLSTSFNTTSYALQFDPYGAATQTAGGTNGGTTQNPYSFHAGLQDRATGYIKFGARWYDPATGTWTQQDTYNAPLSPGNANRYAYAGGDPINASDPTGNDWWAWGVETVIAGAALAFAPVAVPLTIVGVGYAALVELCGAGSPTADDPNVC